MGHENERFFLAAGPMDGGVGVDGGRGVDDGIVADGGSGLDDGGGDPGPEGRVVVFQDGGWDSICHRLMEVAWAWWI